MRHILSLATMLAIGGLAGCSGNTSKSPDASVNIRESLERAGMKDVTVSTDRDKGVVTLGGHVPSEVDKATAAAIAQPLAPSQVVSNQIAVLTVGSERASGEINADLDKGIEHLLDAELIRNKLHGDVKYSVTNHVVTLTGAVRSQVSRERAEAIAAKIPNVHQVVNELQIKGMKATSSN